MIKIIGVSKFFTIFLILLWNLTILAQIPINDSYKNAIEITNLNNWCSNSNAYTNVNATPDPINTPSCWTSTRSHDVWFSFIATATSVNIVINGQGTGLGTLLYPQISLYLPIDSVTLSQRGCSEASSSNPSYTSLFEGGLFLGAKYYIRVDGKDLNTGTFQLCINNYIPVGRDGQDCNTAVFLCNKNTITHNALNGYGSVIEGQGTCLAGFNSQPEKNSIWYYWEAANDGPLTFTIYPNMPNDDIDFAIYELIDGCNNKKHLRCEGAQCLDANNRIIGPTGINMTSTDTVETGGCANGQDNFVKYLDMKKGKKYALFINNYTDDNVGSDNGFTIQFGGSGEFVGINVEASPDQTICLGNSVQLDAMVNKGTPPYTFLWGPAQTLNDTAIKNPIATPLTTTKYIVMVTDSIGCAANSDVTITVTSPTIDFNANVLAGCSPLYVSFTPMPATNLASCLWDFGDGGTSTEVYPTYIFNSPGTYNIKLTIVDNKGCNATIQKDTYIHVYNNGTIDFTSNVVSGCPPLTVNFLPVTTDSIISCLWNFGDGNSSTLLKPSHTYLKSGNYNVKLTVTNSNGCGAALQKNNYITVFITPKALFSIHPPVATNIDPVIYFSNNSINAATAFWNFGDSTYSNEISPTHKYEKASDYWVKLIVWSNQGCSDTTSTMVSVMYYNTFYVPNAFSPDNDKNNDEFRVLGYGIDSANFQMIIYDRWGEKVFETTKLNEPWRGQIKNNNRTALPGVYTWLVYYAETNGRKLMKSGKVVIIK